MLDLVSILIKGKGYYHGDGKSKLVYSIRFLWVQVALLKAQVSLQLGKVFSSGPVFMKGLRLSQVLGLNPVLKLRLLSQLSFVLKLCSQRVT